jgi:2',3'-cyclic-nucleotide 2'-phosphodiesterase (5'-nucleotidase family)
LKFPKKSGLSLIVADQIPEREFKGRDRSDTGISHVTYSARDEGRSFPLLRPGTYSMKRKGLLFSGTMIVLCLELLIGSGLGADEGLFTLIYTSNTLGQVDPSCCSNKGAGGLAKRARYMKEVRLEVQNLLILDGGGLFPIVPSSGDEEEIVKTRRRGKFVLKLYEKLGYQSINIGETDLALGIGYLKSLSKASNIRFLSANIKEKATRDVVFEPYLIKRVDGLKVGILGLLTPDVASYALKAIDNYFIEDPVKVAADIIGGPMSNCDYIIALAHLKPAEIDSLCNRVPRISIVIGGDDRSFVFGKRVNHSIWVQTDAFGHHVGRLNLRLVRGSSEFVDVLPPELIQKNIEEIEKGIASSQSVQEMIDLGTMQEILQEILNEKKTGSPSAEGKNTYENFLKFLGPKVESDQEIEELISSEKGQ